MPTETPTSQETTTTSAPRPDWHEQVRGLMSCQASSNPAYCEQALEHVTRAVDGFSASLEIRDGGSVIQQVYHLPDANGPFWAPTVQSALTEVMSDPRSSARLFQSRQGNMRIALLCNPVHDASGNMIGAVAVLVFCEDKDRARLLLTRLQALSCWLNPESRESRKNAERLVGNRGNEEGIRPEIAQRAARYQSPMELAFAIVNHLRSRTHCEQVALGMVRGTRVQVSCVSGQDHVGSRHPGVLDIQSAMEECLDQEEVLVVQSENEWDESAATGTWRLHRKWHEATGGAAVASIPLMHEESCCAILSLRRHAENPFTAAQLQEYRNIVEPYAPAFELVQRARRGLTRHLLDNLRELPATLVGREHWLRNSLVAVGLLVLGWFVMGTSVYELTVPCRLAPKESRHFNCPVDAILVDTTVRPGDLVEAGQILCVFDTSDVDLRIAQTSAQIAMAELDERRAMAAGTILEQQMAANRIKELTATRAMDEALRDASVLVAPSDGFIVEGDFEERRGDMFQRGEPLFVFSTDLQWRLELEVPEGEVRQVEPKLSGLFSPRARPDDEFSFEIDHLGFHAEQRGRGNVYVAEASVDLDGRWMRAGMEGMAVIEVGPRPVWWIHLHSLLDAVRMKVL